MKCISELTAIIAFVLVNGVVSGCSEKEPETVMLNEDFNIQQITEKLTHNMEVNKQEAIDEIAPHLDKLKVSFAKLCGEIQDNPELLEQCNARLSEISKSTEAIKSGDFDSVPRS